MIVAVLWTVSALAAEIATKRSNVMVLNVWRMSLALLISVILIWFTTGCPLPFMAGIKAWAWLLLSGFVGYFLGDWCLFKSYILIGSRCGQLFMTLAPAFTAFFAWVILKQALSWTTLIAIFVTLSGIFIAVTDSKGAEEGSPITHKGILLGIGAALGQGLGLVLSKIGLDCFISNIQESQLDELTYILPFGSNLIRCIAGTICYFLWYMISRSKKNQPKAIPLSCLIHDRKAMKALTITLISGPFLGVGLSLTAVQYTAAGIASTLMATTPILILLPSYWLFKQPITLKSIIGSIISCIGVSLFFLV